MTIQWFPGHMGVAKKNAADAMRRIDLVIEVVDARVPEASSNPMIRQLREHRQRPCLKILNKADLADPAATQGWLAHYGRQKGVTAVALSCKKPGDAAKIPALAQAILPQRDSPARPLRMMIMGIPNVGKSTLMNALLRRRAAAVGDEPAITKAQQVIDLGDHMTLTDTPGLLWPRIDDPRDGYLLAASHAIAASEVPEEEVALFLGELLLERYPARLEARYGSACAGMDGAALLEAIARRRGCQAKGGALDLAKAARILLHDYRNGQLGRISLETPRTRAARAERAAS